MNDDDKKSKNKNIILLESLKKECKIELTEEEQKLKEKLCNIENKLESVEKVILDINNTIPDTPFDSETFIMLVGSIAITAAINVVAEYFEIDKHEIEKFMK